MTRPGVVVTSTAVSAASGPPTSMGPWFVAGITERGPLTVDPNAPVRSMADYAAVFGDRVSYGTLYDSLDTFFRLGGSQAFISRVVGPTPTVSSRTLVDRAGSPLNTLRVDAKNPGVWGTRVSVSVANGVGSNTFTLTVYYDGVAVEQSSDLSSPADAVTWAATYSHYVVITDLASATVAPNNNPAVLATSALTGGNDDRTNIVDASWQTALDRFTADLGPGQVSQPTRTTSAAHLQTIEHAAAKNRQALLDGVAGSSATTLASLAGTLRSGTSHDEYGALFAPWLTIPGLTSGTTRTVPPSAVAAGLLAAQDRLGDANVPAAGQQGVASYVLDLAQTAFTDAERQTLNDAGVNVFRNLYGTVRLYGFRTLDLGDWRALNNQRLRIQITNAAKIVGEGFPFTEIDPRGRTLAAFNGALVGMLQPYFLSGALYGASAAEAYNVDTGPGINTPTTLANGELHAVLSLRMSPFAELVQISIVKYPNTQPLPVA